MDQKKRKKPGGRKPLSTNEKRTKSEYWLNAEERNTLNERVKDSVYRTNGAFVRSLILNESNRARHINPVRFLKDISQLAFEINKVGININQLAKHANEMAIQKIVHPDFAKTIEETITTYTLKQDAIMTKLKEVIKSR